MVELDVVLFAVEDHFVTLVNVREGFEHLNDAQAEFLAPVSLVDDDVFDVTGHATITYELLLDHQCARANYFVFAAIDDDDHFVDV